MHLGYVRNYERAIRLLLEEGHEVHVAVANPTKKSPDRIAERFANEFLNFTISRAPKIRQGNSDSLRRALRGLADFMRYQHPRYRDSHALRARARAKLLRRRDSALSAFAITLYLPTLGRIRHAAYADAASAWALRLANALPVASRPTRWLRGLAPHVFLTTPHLAIGSTDPEFLDAARELRIPSALLVTSWDNLTNKGLIKSPTDLVVVWNEAQRAEAVQLHGVPAERVAVTGAQRFDDWFEISASGSREEFATRVGLDPGRPYVLYLCSSPFIAPDEVPFVRRLVEALRASDGPLAGAGVLIRPHPQNAEQWATADFSDCGNVVIWPREGEQPVRDSSKQGFYDSMYHSLAVVGINTSAQIEAGIVGRSVHTVLDPQFADSQQGTLHFKHLLVEHGGLLYVAADLAELVRNLEAVHAGALDDDHAQRFVADFIRPHGIDRPASPLVADAIRQLLDGPSQSSVEPIRPEAGTRALLALLVGLSFPADPRRLPGLATRGLRKARSRAAAHLRRTAIEALRRGRRSSQDGIEAPAPAQAQTSQVFIVEPWPADLAGEMLYWIPFLRHLHRSLPWDTRIVVVTDGGDPRWYAMLDPEFVVDERELPAGGLNRLEYARLLRARGETATPRFIGPSDHCEALCAGIRADKLAWTALDRDTEVRSLFAMGRPGAGPAGTTWSGVRPELVGRLLTVAEAGRPMAVVLVEAPDDGPPEIIELDLTGGVALTDGLERAQAAISTDVGVAALAISMGVPTMLLLGRRAGPAADVDVLDRMAAQLEVDLEIVEPAALRLLLLGDRRPSDRPRSSRSLR